MRSHLVSYLAGAVLLAATLWMSFAIPRNLAGAIDLLAHAGGGDEGALGGYVLSIAGFAVAIIVTRTGSRLFFFVPGRRVEFEMKNRLLEHLTGLQRDFYAANPSGAIISRINNDINGVRMLLGPGVMMVCSSAGTLSLAPFYMYGISPGLTLYCALPLIFCFALLQLGVRRMRVEQLRSQSALQRLSDFTVESYNGIDVLKSFRTYPWAERRFGGLSAEVRDAAIRMSTVRAYLMPLLLHLTNGLKMLVVLVGGGLVIAAASTPGGLGSSGVETGAVLATGSFLGVSGGMSVGELSAYLLYLSMLVSPLMGMTFMVFILQRGFTGLSSLLEVLSSEPSLPPVDPGASARLRPSSVQGGRALSVRGLHYAYPDDPQQPALEAVSFSLLPGEIVGVFGPVGCGKSTLVNVINGVLQPPGGTVFVDGVDASTLGHSALRSEVGTVSQEPFLFSDTIRENVLLGIDEDEMSALDLDRCVHQAVEAAALVSDLERMPAGLETLVGEKGITLSGGQKQRVALARAFLAPRPIMLLDDVFSAVDHETERYLIRQIYRLRERAAVLLVSHRISALEGADRIVVLDRGRVVQIGPHRELCLRPGPYREAWRLQDAEAWQRPEGTDG